MMNNNVLVVDSDQMMLTSLTSLLQNQGGFLNVLSAINGRQALAIMREKPVKIVITAIRTMDVDGFQLVAQLAKEFPATRVIVMSSDNTPLLRARITQFPSAIFLDQTRDLTMLSKRVFTELQIEYGGQVRGINLTSFLQMMALEAVSCLLKVTGKDQSGCLWLDNGELVAAELSGETGKSAAMKILAWKNVFIDIDYAPRQVAREITEPLMMLMLESSRVKDEHFSENTDKREHERYGLLMAIDINIKNMKRHCSIWDICQQGAYIETDHDINIGEAITLSLNSPIMKNSCNITAKVVRKDGHGIGVKFLPTTPHQQQIVQAMISNSINLLSGG